MRKFTTKNILGIAVMAFVGITATMCVRGDGSLWSGLGFLGVSLVAIAILLLVLPREPRDDVVEDAKAEASKRPGSQPPGV